MSDAYIKNEHWTFFAKQNRKKEKTKRQFELKGIFVLIFEFACKIGVYVQEADVLVREHRRTKEFIQFVQRKINSCVNRMIPLGSNSVIAFISLSVSSLDDLVEDEADRSMPSGLDVDTGFWMQGDPMRHSITL